jgi:hypothetical protein
MTWSTSATPFLALSIFYASMGVQNSSAFGTVALPHPPSSKNNNAALFLFSSCTRAKTSSPWTTRRKTEKRPRVSQECFGAARISTTPASSTTTALECQLLGMNCATPTDFSFSFKGFCRRGGETDVHADGWGLAVYEDSGLRQFHDVQAASESPMAQFLSNYPIRTLVCFGPLSLHPPPPQLFFMFLCSRHSCWIRFCYPHVPFVASYVHICCLWTRI